MRGRGRERERFLEIANHLIFGILFNCRDIADCECTHNNSCNWFRSFIPCMGYSPVGLGHRHGSSDDFLFYHLFHLDFIGRQLPITGPPFPASGTTLTWMWFALI